MGRLLGNKPGDGLAPSTYSKDAYPLTAVGMPICHFDDSPYRHLSTPTRAAADNPRRSAPGRPRSNCRRVGSFSFGLPCRVTTGSASRVPARTTRPALRSLSHPCTRCTRRFRETPLQ